MPPWCRRSNGRRATRPSRRPRWKASTRFSWTCWPWAPPAGAKRCFRLALHQRRQVPEIPGIDGVGRLPDGNCIYFVANNSSVGHDGREGCRGPSARVPLPEGVDTVKVAAAMNPAMSSWVALRRRVPLEPGQDVLILGATGNAGLMAVQVAKLLGARRVIGAGRDVGRLRQAEAAGADAVVPLAHDVEDLRRPSRKLPPRWTWSSTIYGEADGGGDSRSPSCARRP